MSDTIERFKTLLTPIFKKYPEIVAVYLFGSFSKQENTEFSDIDLGILYDKDLTKTVSLNNKFSLQNEIWSQIQIEPQIVNLNKTNLIFQHRILVEGILIYESNYIKRTNFAEKIVIEYCDFEPIYQRSLNDLFSTMKVKYGHY